MDVKSITHDPRAAIGETWGSLEACPVSDTIDQLVSELKTVKSRIKHAKQEKAGISRQFKDAKDDPERIATLKEEMAVVSNALSAHEEQRKTLEARLLACFDSGSGRESPPFPERFRFNLPAASSSPKVAITKIGESDAAAWDAYVEAHPGSSLYHLYSWKKIIERSFGHHCYYYAAKDARERIIGVLPLVQLKSRLFGSYAVSLPFFNYGGAVADDRGVAERLIDHAQNEAQRHSWQHIEYRTCDEQWKLPSTSRKVSMILKLPHTAAQLDDGLKAKVRAQYKQTHQYRPTIAFGGAELLDEYYRVFARNMRDLGTPVYSRAFFRTILEELPEHSTIVVVTLGKTPVGVAFLAGYKDVLEIPWASTLKEYNSYNINMWMYRQILGYAIEKGYHFFDFGRSTVDAGTYHFKKQWGAKPLRHHWYYHLSPGESVPELNPDNPKFRLAIATWKKLPVFVTNLLGPPIVRNLP